MMHDEDFVDGYRFAIPVGHESELRVLVWADDTTLKVEDIYVEGPEDHPDSFSTTNQDDNYGGSYSTGVRLGTKEMRRVLLYVLNTVRQDHPNVRSVQADRVTGARYASGNRDLALDLPAARA